MVQISHLDHWVLTVRDIEATCRFYSQVLGMAVITFGNNRKALQFGHQKINLHQAGAEIQPHADCPQPGSADFCLMLVTPLEGAIAHLHALNIAILVGPVQRTGATGPIQSIYLRDPDGNLIELACPLSVEEPP
ncbi:MAG: VOC family protein [Cyanobacteria bacterium Co-bin13]|nr:VOC family protein [Cyanobacteria bacterium Co-bin13]